MGRGKQGLFDGLTTLPWPAVVGLGVLGYLLIGHGAPLLLARHGGPLANAFIGQSHLATTLAFAVLAMSLLAALTSWLRSRHRRRLLDTRNDLDSLARLGWRQFELLVGEAFRRQGYAVEETGLGGADGGIDLILRRNGKRILVQCKQWRRERVPVNVVREMYGLLAHHQADAVRIAALGGFTRDAARFADGKPIELIDGRALLEMIRKMQADANAATVPMRPPRVEPVIEPVAMTSTAAPACPRCGAAMVERENRRKGRVFWGCTGFPACRGTR